MPRDGSDIYSVPIGTEGVPDTTIESNKYNTFIYDVETDLNTPRPILAGGTDASSADEALFNLGAEKAQQVVTNFDSHAWLPGSFYAAAGATNAPVAGHRFVGHVEILNTNNGAVYAHDIDSTSVPPAVYVRQKKDGTWSAWSADPGTVTGTAPPAGATVNSFWWDNETGLLYILYDDGNSVQWVVACPQPATDMFVLRQGDTMTGPLNLLPGAPVADAEAANKKYVDDAIDANVPPPPFPPGTVMVFYQAAAPVGWTRVITEHDKALRVVGSTPGGVAGGTNAFSAVMAQANVGNHTLTTAEIPAGIYSTALNSITVYPGGTAGYYFPVSLASFSNSGPNGGGGVPFDPSWGQLTYDSGNNTIGVYSSGGGGAHNHPITMAMQYVDVILASKDA